MKLSTRIYSFSFLFCVLFSVSLCKSASPSNGKTVLRTEKSNSVKSLRLTYDVEWKPAFSFDLLESGNMHESGTTYKVQPFSSDFKLPFLRISSTNQDNQRRFPYLRQTGTVDTTTFYFSQKKIKAAVQVHSFTKEYYVRWETVYHGFLIVSESEFSKEMGLDPETIGKKFNDLMYGSLELF